MFEAALARWGSVLSLFFSAPATLMAGGTSSFAVVGGLGIALLVLGLVFIALLRARQAWRLIFPLLIAGVTPFLYAFASMVGTVASALFVFIVAVLGIIIWVANIARDAAGRKPGIWLFGLGLMAFALLGIMVEVTLPVSIRPI